MIGRPNVGKSTLMNKLIGKNVTITSPVAQTTRNKLKGILTTDDAQIIFIDTPGVHKPHHLLGEKLVRNAKSAIKGVDLVLLIFDSFYKPGKGDEYIRELLVSNKCKFIVVLNKWDLLDDDNQMIRKNQYQELLKDNLINFQEVSALTGYGCPQLIEQIKQFLPHGNFLYPEDTVVDQPLEILLAELIREQVLINTREEIPHSVAVKIEKIQNIISKRKNTTAILANIIVERKSQKGILIGKKGSMLKRIGKSARLNMQKLVEDSIYLELFVKVIPNWRKKESKLIEYGYEEDT